MNNPLSIKSNAALDFLSLGALNHRVDSGVIPFSKATQWQVYPSGGEYNVAANLSNCFKLKTGLVSAMVDYPIGELISEKVRAMGVQPFYKHFKHNGVNGPNMATIYSDQGFGIRGPVVFYNRANEAAALLKPGDIDWQSIFTGGVRWFHSGGIFASLSETTGEVIIEGMKAAKAGGAVISFDLNYRAKLWNIWGGQEKAVEVLKCIIENVDVLVGNEEDLQLGLGIKEETSEKKSKLDSAAFFSMITEVISKFPNVKAVATTLRDVHSTNHHTWGAVAWMNGEKFISPVCELPIHDRVGGGDGFAAGFFYGLLAGESVQNAVNLGWAHGALLTTTPGDTTMVTLEQVQNFANGGSARIQR